MNVMLKVLKYDVRDLVRSRWLLGYAAFFAVITDALVRFGGSSEKALLSLVSITLFIVPLVALVFGTVYLYNAREFTELLLAHPVNRRQLFGGLYLGLTLPLALAFVLGVAVPLLLEGLDDAGQRVPFVMLLVAGAALTAIFTAVAFLIATRTEDRLKGLGVAIAAWLAAAVVYDGLVLVAVLVFGDYPLERPMLVAMFLNPLDLARVLLLLQFDASALLGYTGAVFRQFFTGISGTLVSLAALAAWIAAPIVLGVRAFQRKDF
ncbi:MAG TPA: ABC transporter permease subunit [Gemmatimonadaceae bacterium]|nr:ABC transporter permease subunit [Gemmatimonadaceae bacterium]